MFRFDPKKLDCSQVLGSGRFGNIYPYKTDSIDDRWVVKHVFARDFDRFKIVMEEIVLSFNLEHSAVLPIAGYHVEARNPGWDFYIKMVRMNGSLEELLQNAIKSKSTLSEDAIAYLFDMLTSGIEYLHSKKIAHGDIKPSNMLIDKEGKVRIADIGIAKFVAEDEALYNMIDTTATPYYAAPEILSATWQLTRKELFKADLWSLGMVMLEICLLKLKAVPSTLPKADKKDLVKKSLEQLEGKINRTLVDIIEGLLRWDPEDRMSIREVRGRLEAQYGHALKRKESHLQRELEMMLKDRSSDKVSDDPQAEQIGLGKVRQDLEGYWKDVFEVGESDGIEMKAKDPKKIENLTIQELLNQINRGVSEYMLRGLQSLSLSFERCKKVTDNGLFIIATHIKKHFEKLKNLSLRFADCYEITDNGVANLSQAISGLSHLNYLFLDFRQCKQITNAGMQNLAANFNRSLQNLTKFHLLLNQCYQINDQGLICLAKEFLSTLSNLQDISLILDWCPDITDKGLIELGRSISPDLTTIRSISFSFANCSKITNDGLHKLYFHVASNSYNLKLISFNFRGCEEIDDQGMKNMTTYFVGKVSRLSSLSLCFNDCFQISDKGLVELTGLFYQNPYLQSLLLDFQGCSDITDKGLKELVVQLGTNLRDLKKLSLRFLGCNRITDQAIGELGNQISKHLRRLEDVRINLEYCDKVSEQARAGLKQAANFVAIANID